MQIEKITDIAPYIPLMEECVGVCAERELYEYQQNGQYLLFGTENGIMILMPTPDNCDLIDIAVSKSARKNGIGTALLDYAAEYCKKENIPQIMLEVRASNENAIRFYIKNGFEQIATRRNYYHAPQEDALIMRKTV